MSEESENDEFLMGGDNFLNQQGSEPIPDFKEGIEFKSKEAVRAFLTQEVRGAWVLGDIETSIVDFHNDTGHVQEENYKVFVCNTIIAVTSRIDVDQELPDEEGNPVESMTIGGLHWKIFERSTGAIIKDDAYVDDWYHAIGKNRALAYFMQDLADAINGPDQVFLD